MFLTSFLIFVLLLELKHFQIHLFFLTISISLSHTHTLSPSLSLSLSLCVFRTLSLSLSLLHTHYLSLLPSLVSLSLFLSFFNSLSLTLEIHFFWHTPSYTQSLKYIYHCHFLSSCWPFLTILFCPIAIIQLYFLAFFSKLWHQSISPFSPACFHCRRGRRFDLEADSESDIDPALLQFLRLNHDYILLSQYIYIYIDLSLSLCVHPSPSVSLFVSLLLSICYLASPSLEFHATFLP